MASKRKGKNIITEGNGRKKNWRKKRNKNRKGKKRETKE